VQANLRHAQSIEAAARGADVVINLVGILYERGRQRFDAVQSFGAEQVALAAAAHGARMIHVSAIGADENSLSAYGRSKAAGEKAVLAAVPSATILRPSLLFGPEDQFTNRFAALARISPFLPLIGGGRTRFQPVYAGDVGAAIAAACAGRGRPDAVYELGGPEIISFRQLLDRTLAWSGRRRAYLRIPFALAKLGALLTAPLPNNLRPLTVDQIRMLQRDSVVSDAAASDGRGLAGLGVSKPHSMEAIVPSYLGRFQPQGQFADYRG